MIKANGAIEHTEKTGNDVHIMKQQTTIVKAAMKQIASTVNQTQTLYTHLNCTEASFINNLQLLRNATEKIFNILQSNELQNIYTLLINQYAYHTLNQIVKVTKMPQNVMIL